MPKNNFPKAGDYIKNLKEKQKKSRVYSKNQAIGLALGEILEDRSHKILYMSLAKQYDGEVLLALAKDIAQRREVKELGAYFMKVLKAKVAENKIFKKPAIKKKKQLRLKIRSKSQK